MHRIKLIILIQKNTKNFYWEGALIRAPFFEKNIFFKHVGLQLYNANKDHRECIETHHFHTKIQKFSGPPPHTYPTTLFAFGARPLVPLSDGLDTRPCKILDPRLERGN